MFRLIETAILTWLFSTAIAASSFGNATITSSPSTLRTTTSKVSKTMRSCLYPLQSAVDSGSAEDGHYNDCNRPGDPLVLGGNYNPYKYASWTSVASTCSVSFESELSSWMATADYHTQSIIYTPEEGGAPYTTQYHVNYNEFFPFVPKQPCCLNCTLIGGDVQVYYWPTPAPNPPVTKLVNSANFTFISPSIYVGFNSLYATNLCGHEGKDIIATTLGFAPGELSTAMAYQYNGTGPNYLYLGNNFTAASFGGDDVVCGNVTKSFMINNIDGMTYPIGQPLPASVQSYCSQTWDNCNFDDYWITYNPCSPTLSVPSQIFTLNPEWKGCIQGIDAFFDPPYSLTPGNGLTPFAAPADPTPAPTAQPANTPNSPIAAPTTAQDNKPPSSPSPKPNTSPSRVPLPANTPDPSPNVDPNPSPTQESNPPPVNDPGEAASPSKNDPLTQDPSPPNQQQPTQNIPQPATDPAAANSPIAQPSPSPTPFIPVIIGTQTIIPGDPAVTISGTIYSLPLTGSALIINGVTTQLPTPDSPDSYILASQTLIAGGAAITVSSLLVSLMNGGQSVVIGGTTTEAFGSVFTSAEIVMPTAGGLGGVIISLGGFGGDPPQVTGGEGANETGFNGITFLGAGVRRELEWWSFVVSCGIVLGILAL